MKYFLSLLLVAFCSLARADESCVPYLECQPIMMKATKGPLATHLFWFVRNPDTRGIDHHGFSWPNGAGDIEMTFAILNGMLLGKYPPSAVWAVHMRFRCDYSNFNPIPDEHPICKERKLALMLFNKDWLEDEQ